MSKVSITLDVSKFNKSKITERKYINKAGVEVTEKNYKVDLIPLNQVKVIKETDTYVLKKTHFVVEAQTKEERAAKKPQVYVGVGMQFDEPLKNKPRNENVVSDGIEYPDDDINAEDIPF